MQRFGGVDKDTPHVQNTDEFHNWLVFGHIARQKMERSQC